MEFYENSNILMKPGGLMEEVTTKIGHKIKVFRNKKRMTILELAEAICKSKATVSKYENGQISIDILTLYDIAKVLGVHVEELLYSEPANSGDITSKAVPAFFRARNQFYLYYFDGRNNSLNRCVLDVLTKSENNSYKVMLYMNIDSYERYQNCENTYWGYLRHYDSLSSLVLYNRDMPMEQVTINMLATFLDSPTKWGLFMGISSRPLMPIALKILTSQRQLPETPQLLKKLRLSKEDMRQMKLYNMMVVT